MSFQLRIHPACHEITEELPFTLFRHAGLLCCVQRAMRMLTLNGYVAVDQYHPLYGKSYDDTVFVKDHKNIKFNNNWIGALLTSFAEETELGIYRLDMAIDVHCGLTYADDSLAGIEDGLFGKLWWFGFDTAHAGDQQPLQFLFNEREIYNFPDYVYRNKAFVETETRKLADQLAAFLPERSDIEQAYINYKQQRVRV